MESHGLLPTDEKAVALGGGISRLHAFNLSQRLLSSVILQRTLSFPGTARRCPKSTSLHETPVKVPVQNSSLLSCARTSTSSILTWPTVQHGKSTNTTSSDPDLVLAYIRVVFGASKPLSPWMDIPMCALEASDSSIKCLTPFLFCSRSCRPNITCFPARDLAGEATVRWEKCCPVGTYEAPKPLSRGRVGCQSAPSSAPAVCAACTICLFVLVQACDGVMQQLCKCTDGQL
jgi:hypothetical protein